MRKRERNGAPKTNVLTLGSLVANPKSGLDYSVRLSSVHRWEIVNPVWSRCLIRQLEAQLLFHVSSHTCLQFQL
jgi:hypothetical protein